MANNKEEIDEMKKKLITYRNVPYDNRLLTFSVASFSNDMPVTAVKMVASGFVAMETASGRYFGCPDCQLIVSEFSQPFVDPREDHETSSPKCPHVLKIKKVEERVSASFDDAPAKSEQTAGSRVDTKDSIILRRVEKETRNIPKRSCSMRVEKNRKKTFEDGSHPVSQIAKVFASHGLYLKGREMKCVWCTFQVNWTKEIMTNKVNAQELINTHVTSYKCDFITGRDGEKPNIPDLFHDECWKSKTSPASLEDSDPNERAQATNVNGRQPEHPGMTGDKYRVATFLTFPRDSNQQPEKLAEAGYFYNGGKSDTVTCFMCGVVSSDWGINETPWQRHARSSRTCQHVMSQKGEEFVRHTLEEQDEYRPQDNNINESPAESPDGFTAEHAQEYGFSMDQIKKAKRNRTMGNGQEFKNLEEITRALHSGHQPDLNNYPTSSNRTPKVVSEPIEVIPSDDDGTNNVDSTSHQSEWQDIVYSGQGRKDKKAKNELIVNGLRETVGKVRMDADVNAENIQLLAQGILAERENDRDFFQEAQRVMQEMAETKALYDQIKKGDDQN